MASTTTKHGWPKPDGTDLLNQGDDAIRALADAQDATVAIDDQGSLVNRPTSTPGSPGKAGRYYKATDTGQIFRDHGTGWDELAVQGPVLTGLPVGAVEGREIVVSADGSGLGTVGSSPGLWRLKRVGSLWKYLGGTPMRGQPVTTNSVRTSSVSVFTQFTDLNGAGSRLALPFIGTYTLRSTPITVQRGSAATGTVQSRIAVGTSGANLIAGYGGATCTNLADLAVIAAEGLITIPSVSQMSLLFASNNIYMNFNVLGGGRIEAEPVELDAT